MGPQGATKAQLQVSEKRCFCRIHGIACDAKVSLPSAIGAVGTEVARSSTLTSVLIRLIFGDGSLRSSIVVDHGVCQKTKDFCFLSRLDQGLSLLIVNTRFSNK